MRSEGLTSGDIANAEAFKISVYQRQVRRLDHPPNNQNVFEKSMRTRSLRQERYSGRAEIYDIAALWCSSLISFLQMVDHLNLHVTSQRACPWEVRRLVLAYEPPVPSYLAQSASKSTTILQLHNSHIKPAISHKMAGDGHNCTLQMKHLIFLPD